MQRAIVAPANLAAAALTELKEWLAITTARDDAALTALLRAGLDTCEGFTRLMPLETLCEEVLPATAGWQQLATMPVRSITGVESLALDGTRVELELADHFIDITADGCGRVRLARSLPSHRLAVRFSAGLAPAWEALPDGLRHGIVRLAAHNYRERDDPQGQPPAAVAASWQPWRRICLT